MLTFIRGGEGFLSQGQVHVKLLPNGESVPLTTNRNLKYAPVFTPDGARVAYTELTPAGDSWDTWTVPVLGGPPRMLLPNASAQDLLAPAAGRCQPDVLDRAGALDGGEHMSRAGAIFDEGRDLPPLTRPALARAGAFGGPPALPLLSGRVLRADRAGLALGQPPQVRQPDPQPVPPPVAIVPTSMSRSPQTSPREIDFTNDRSTHPPTGPPRCHRIRRRRRIR